MPAWTTGLQSSQRPYAKECFIRMLFSALVDADWLDTEAFMQPGRARQRGQGESIEVLLERLHRHLAELQTSAADTPVNGCRLAILEQCLEAAVGNLGAYDLTVPTGGGKTLSSMAFALEHAVLHGLSRVIVAIPYTSIIEQNAQIYRDILGEENVLEHHCSLDPDKETDKKTAEEHDQKTDRNDFASENWDAPIIVTTNVQLLESLFANRTTKCRKLHNIANSIVILDEAQSLPLRLLKPTLSMLNTLVVGFRTSIVFCTATQPI